MTSTTTSSQRVLGLPPRGGSGGGGRRRQAVAGRALVLALLVAMMVSADPATSTADTSTTGGPTAAGTCGTAWTRAAAPGFGVGGGWLDAVDARAATDAWAVGTRTSPTTGKGEGVALRWDGSRWRRVRTPHRGIADGLTDVAVFGRRRAWAVGYYQQHDPSQRDVILRTSVLHWDGTAWVRVASPNAGTIRNGSLGGVAHVGKDAAWAVGSYGDPNPRALILHWNGEAWKRVRSPEPPYPETYLTAVDGSGPRDVWAVGRTVAADGRWRTLAMHYNGRSWRIVPTPNRTTIQSALEDVVVLAPDDAWAVGSSAAGPIALHWDGDRWTRDRSAETDRYDSLSGIDATRPSRVMAVGAALAGSGASHRVVPMVHRWNGSSWTRNTQARIVTSDTWLEAVAMTATRQWAVGSYVGDDGTERPHIQQRCTG